MTQQISISTWNGAYSREITIHLASTEAKPEANYIQSRPLPDPTTPGVAIEWRELDGFGYGHPVVLQLLAYDPQTIRDALEAALAALPKPMGILT